MRSQYGVLWSDHPVPARREKLPTPSPQAQVSSNQVCASLTSSCRAESLSGPTLSTTPSAPTCLATGRPGGIVTFSRPRPAKLWTRTRGAWHGQYKTPIPSLLGWKPRPNRECNVSHWRRLRVDSRGLRPRKFEARRQCSTMLSAQAWCHIKGRVYI